MKHFRVTLADAGVWIGNRLLPTVEAFEEHFLSCPILGDESGISQSLSMLFKWTLKPGFLLCSLALCAYCSFVVSLACYRSSRATHSVAIPVGFNHLVNSLLSGNEGIVFFGHM